MSCAPDGPLKLNIAQNRDIAMLDGLAYLPFITLLLFLSGLSDLLKAYLDDRANLRGVPLGVLGLLRPDKRKVLHRSGCVSLF